MKELGTTIECYRGEAFKIERELVDADGMPLIISDSVKNLFARFTVKSNTYKIDGEYVKNYWTDLSSLKRFSSEPIPLPSSIPVKLEYVESKGNGYFELPIPLEKVDKVEMTIVPTDLSKDYTYFYAEDLINFQISNESTRIKASSYVLGYPEYHGTTNVGIAVNSSYGIKVDGYNRRLELSLTRGSIIYSGDIGGTSTHNLECTKVSVLAKKTLTTEATDMPPVKLYALKIRNRSGTLIHDYTPMYDLAAKEVYLLDKITGDKISGQGELYPSPFDVSYNDLYYIVSDEGREYYHVEKGKIVPYSFKLTRKFFNSDTRKWIGQIYQYEIALCTGELMTDWLKKLFVSLYQDMDEVAASLQNTSDVSDTYPNVNVPESNDELAHYICKKRPDLLEGINIHEPLVTYKINTVLQGPSKLIVKEN